MPRISKARAETIHASRRLGERTPITPSKAVLRALARKIRTNARGCRFVLKQSNRVTHWDVLHEGRVLRLFYDKVRGRVVTVLWSRPE